jgi:hypothetical protein
MAACLFLFLTVVFVAPTYGAGAGEYIVKYRVEDAKTEQLIMERDFQTGASSEFASIIEGADLKVTITVVFNYSNPSATLKLSTSMEHSSLKDHYWELETQGYQLGDYNPNQQYVQFNQISGTLDISCYGRIPVGIVTKSIDGIVLHKPVPIALIALTSPGGELLDQIKPNVTDAKIDEYQKLLNQKEDKLQSLRSSGVSPGYVEIFGNVVNEAKAQGDQGFVDNAIALLNGLAVSSEPASSFMEMLFLPAMGILAAVSVAFGFLFLRARGKISYVLLVIEDQIKDLEGLTLRASKIDRTISSSLTGIEDRLKRLVGM